MNKSILGFCVLILSSTVVSGRESAHRPSKAVKGGAAAMGIPELRAHIRFLADDLLEGRKPGSVGDRIAQRYIASQFEEIALLPAAPGGSWFQEFGVMGVTSNPPSLLTVVKGKKQASLKLSKDFVASTRSPDKWSRIRNAEIVFVGYGIEAPEYQWNDYKDLDVRGKVLLMMNNDPENDPALFQGKTRLYYGRWTYKYEIAARKGAAAAIIIHTNASAGWPWNVAQEGWSGEHFQLASSEEPIIGVESWVTEEAARRIASLGGRNLDDLRAAAEKRDFQPVPLGVNVSLQMKNTFRQVKTANVLGMLPGSDADKSKEAIVYMAHHDHIGKKENGKKGEDVIYNGAVDNASGVGGVLLLARAFASLPSRPKRSILFAAVAAEEDGLLGSSYLAAHPVVPAGRMAVAFNMDGLGIWGKARDVTFIGKGKSDLDRLIDSVARMQGRTVKPDQFPDKGFFYRSDQFSFAKVGVPAVYFEPGIDLIGKPEGWGHAQSEKWTDTHYHQPNDEYSDDWDLSGALQDLELQFYVGHEIAQRHEMPKWNRGDEFEAARLAALKEVSGSTQPKE